MLVPAVKPAAPVPKPSPFTDSPREFSVEVDGDVFNVRISPLNGEVSEVTESAPSVSATELPEGAVVCEMAGLVLSVDVKTGDKVEEGDPIAMIEAMKMRRPVYTPFGGTVREILAREGEIIEEGAVLMVVE